MREAATILLITVLFSLPAPASDPGLEIRSRGPRQGDPVLIVLTPTSPAISAEGDWIGRKFPFSADGAVMVALVAVDRNQKPGTYPLKVTVQHADGTQSIVSRDVEILATEFETQSLSVDPRFVHLSKEDQARAASDSQRLNAAYASGTDQRLWSGAFIKPAEGRWSSPFGVRRLFNGEERSFHRGADIATGSGRTIHSSNSGRVVLTGDLFFSGNTVIVDHGCGVFTGYLHLTEIWVQEGQQIGAGDIVGLSGATGRVTGPHLHWMLRIDGIVCDAAALLEIDFSH